MTLSALFVIGLLAGMMHARLLGIAICLVVAGFAALVLLLAERNPPAD
ncbi:MAG: hypothetical protein OXH52_21140 [Gammaproteobacteria bacterium]|nr:hypothetical protein [Gammaproteobacteria bacterium]